MVPEIPLKIGNCQNNQAGSFVYILLKWVNIPHHPPRFLKIPSNYLLVVIPWWPEAKTLDFKVFFVKISVSKTEIFPELGILLNSKPFQQLVLGLPYSELWKQRLIFIIVCQYRIISEFFSKLNSLNLNQMSSFFCWLKYFRQWTGHFVAGNTRKPREKKLVRRCPQKNGPRVRTCPKKYVFTHILELEKVALLKTVFFILSLKNLIKICFC